MKIFRSLLLIFLVASCTRHITSNSAELPHCLQKKIEQFKKDNETPVSVTRYQYMSRTVYYMKAACCDRLNIVFDKDCKILGYPDGGITGRGDGSLPGFWKNATDGTIVWKPSSP